MNRSKTKIVKLSPRLQALLDDLPESKKGPQVKHFTPEMDAFILAGWPHKIQTDFTRTFRATFGFGCSQALRVRYRDLTNGKN